MPLRSKPIYIIRPDLEAYCSPGCVKYYYEEELKDVDS